jgi:hypothetical protein
LNASVGGRVPEQAEERLLRDDNPAERRSRSVGAIGRQPLGLQSQPLLGPIDRRLGGANLLGGYAGAHMVQAGEDVTFIDPWPAHVDQRYAPFCLYQPRGISWVSQRPLAGLAQVEEPSVRGGAAGGGGLVLDSTRRGGRMLSDGRVLICCRARRIGQII